MSTFDDLARALRESAVRDVLPQALRAAAGAHPDAEHRAALRAAALACETGDVGAVTSATVTDRDRLRDALAAGGPLQGAAQHAADVAASALRVLRSRGTGKWARMNCVAHATEAALDAWLRSHPGDVAACAAAAARWSGSAL